MGVYHSQFKWIDEQICTYLNKLKKKLLGISMIKNRQIKNAMLIKFMEYNKFIFILKNHEYDLVNQPNWIKQMDIIYDNIIKLLFDDIKIRDIMKIQMQLSRSAGDLGQQKPSIFYILSRLLQLKIMLKKLINILYLIKQIIICII